MAYTFRTCSRTPCGHLALPKGVTLVGYGGSSVQCETQVFLYRGIEIRIPMTEHLTPEQVAEEYNCQSAPTIDEAVEQVDELLQERD